MGDVVQLTPKRKPRHVPPPAYRVLVARAMRAALAEIPPDDHSAALVTILRDGLATLAQLVGPDEAVRAVIALADEIVSASGPG